MSFEEQFETFLQDYRDAFRNVRLEYQFYKHKKNTPEIRRVLQIERNIRELMMKMLQEPLGDIQDEKKVARQRQQQRQQQQRLVHARSNWKEDTEIINSNVGSIYAAERQRELVRFHLIRERVYFFANLVFIGIVFFLTMKHDSMKKESIANAFKNKLDKLTGTSKAPTEAPVPIPAPAQAQAQAPAPVPTS